MLQALRENIVLPSVALVRCGIGKRAHRFDRYRPEIYTRPLAPFAFFGHTEQTFNSPAGIKAIAVKCGQFLKPKIVDAYPIQPNSAGP